jgi:hypothetical protein
MTIALLFFAALVADGANGVPVRDGCGEDAAVLATAQGDDQITVHHGVAGEVLPCYAVSLSRSGTEVRGYVLGSALPAVQEFERRRATESRVPIEAPPPASPGVGKIDKTIEDPGPLAGRQFPPWTGVDLHGRPVSIPGNAKLTLVVFWRPQSKAARFHAADVQLIAFRFNDRGLKTVGLSVGANAAATNYAIEDMTFKIPLALDRSNLATEFGVDANKGATLVLDASGKVVASSSDPKKILAIVSKLLSSE